MARIYVYDNGSTDRTAEVARGADALVRREVRRGKGNVVRRAFADIDADIYVMADGDGTYDASSAPRMVEMLIEQGLDMVIGTRQSQEKEAYRSGHKLGNRAFNRVVAGLFNDGISDIFSGYRVLSRRFVKSFPAMSEGFEIEAEMSIHALQLRMPFAEMPTSYSSREEGSSSKLRTYRDGFQILQYIIRLQRLYRPRTFFGGIGWLLGAMAVALGVPVFVTYLEIGTVPRFPTAILSTGMVVVGTLLWLLGVVLDSTSQLALETKQLCYLSMPGPSRSSSASTDSASQR